MSTSTILSQGSDNMPQNETPCLFVCLFVIVSDIQVQFFPFKQNPFHDG